MKCSAPAAPFNRRNARWPSTSDSPFSILEATVGIFFRYSPAEPRNCQSLRFRPLSIRRLIPLLVAVSVRCFVLFRLFPRQLASQLCCLLGSAQRSILIGLRYWVPILHQVCRQNRLYNLPGVRRASDRTTSDVIPPSEMICNCGWRY